jgi:hypothetical protein
VVAAASGEGDAGVFEVLAEKALDEGLEVLSGFGEGEGAGGFGPVELVAGGLRGDPDLTDGGVGGDDELAGAVLEDDVHDAVVVFELEACVVVLGGDEGLLEGLKGFVGFAAEGGFVDHASSLPGGLYLAGVLFAGRFSDCLRWDGAVGEEMAGSYCGDAQNDGEDDVGEGSAPGAGAHQVEGLEAEGRESGEASADADHDEEAEVLGGGIAAALQGEGAEVADDKGPEHIDENGAEGKSDAVGECETRDGVTQETTQSTADCDPEIGHRLPRCSSDYEDRIGRGHQPGVYGGFGRPHSHCVYRSSVLSVLCFACREASEFEVLFF